MSGEHDITPEEAEAAYQGGRERRAKNLAFAYAAYPWRVRWYLFVRFLETFQGRPDYSWERPGPFRRAGLWVFKKLAPKFFKRGWYETDAWPRFPLHGTAKELRPLHPSRLPKPGATNHFHYYRY